jgi:hypothetical protein
VQDYSLISTSSPRRSTLDRSPVLVLESRQFAPEKLLLHCDISPGFVLLRPQTPDFLFGF